MFNATRYTIAKQAHNVSRHHCRTLSALVSSTIRGEQQHAGGDDAFKYSAAAGLSLGIASALLMSNSNGTTRAEADVTSNGKYKTLPPQKYASPPAIKPHPIEGVNDPPPRPDLPTIPLEEVEEHCDEESMWFMFRGAVYDLTFFKNGHPGGTPVSFLKHCFSLKMTICYCIFEFIQENTLK